MFRRSVLMAILIGSLSHSVFAKTEPSNEISEQFQQAEKLASQGRIAEAIKTYQALLKQQPRLPEVYNNLAALYLKQNNVQQAKSILEQGLHADKRYAALYDSLSAINVAMAREAYSKALQIDLNPAQVSIKNLALNDDTQPQAKTSLVLPKPLPLVAMAEKKTLKPQPEVEVEAKVNPTAEVQPAETLPMLKPVAVVKTQPVVSATVKPVVNNAEVETVLHAWAAAWSAQAVDMYLSFYDQQYHATNGMSRKRWEQQRRVRLKKPEWIKVTLSELKVVSNDGKQAVVKFKQRYQSNTYQDLTSKRMVLRYTGNSWQIFQEKSL